MNRVAAVILSGGKGTRMNSTVSKQYINIMDKPLIYYTIKRFNDSNMVDKIILVLPQEEIEFCKENIIDKYNLHVDEIIAGGNERQDSVLNGLSAVTDENLVLIHDGARPFVSNRIIEDGIRYAIEYGAAAPGVMPKDTIKIKDEDDFSEATLDRSKLVAVQTPQCFRTAIIKHCHEYINKNSIKVTDDTMAVERCGYDVYLYQGEYTNIKMTTPEDLIMAEYLASK